LSGAFSFLYRTPFLFDILAPNFPQHGEPAMSSFYEIFQIPPDFVVKSQAIDSIDFILGRRRRLRVVYQQEIKG
jgi:hypothetical protein